MKRYIIFNKGHEVSTDIEINNKKQARKVVKKAVKRSKKKSDFSEQKKSDFEIIKD